MEIDPQEIAETMFAALEKRMAGKRVRPEVLSIAPRLAVGTEHSGTADRAENSGAAAAQRH